MDNNTTKNSGSQSSAASSSGGATNEWTQRESSFSVHAGVRRSDVRGHIALFHITEIQKGNRCSNNKFTETFLIRKIKQTHLDNDPLIQHSRDWLSSHQLLRTKSKPKDCRFVLKHIRQEFMHSHEEFEAAASYLANEASMIQMLRHNGIAGLYGTSVERTESYYTNGGRHDAFFLIQDMMVETLEQRLGRWKGKSARMRVCQFGGLLPSGRSEGKFIATRLNVAYEVADALEYMHRHNVAYRNFGMDKIGFKSNNEVQLIELGDTNKLEHENQESMKEILFDISTLREAQPSPSSFPIQGSSMRSVSGQIFNDYAAPELLAGDELITEKSVSFSFTKLLSEILTLIVVESEPSCKKASAYVKEFQRISTFLPKELLEQLRRGSSLHPGDRPSMQDFAEAIHMSIAVLSKVGPPTYYKRRKCEEI